MLNSEKAGKPMSESRAVTVGLIGILAEDEQYLQAAFANAAHRTITYTLIAVTTVPQILIVNADLPPALVAWVRYRENLAKASTPVPPTVVMSHVRSFENTQHYQMRSPLIALRTLGLLDRIAAEQFHAEQELAFAPEQVSQTPTSQPATLPTPDQAAAPKQQPLAGASQPADVRALVVDDSLPVRIQMQQALRPIAQHVDFAEDGEKALDLIDSNQYDIIFLDVILPGTDGYEICKVVKSGKNRKTPVIMLTSASTPADRVKGKLAGCDTYLIKPVGHALFQQVVEQYLRLPA